MVMDVELRCKCCGALHLGLVALRCFYKCCGALHLGRTITNF
jgi:hypothetical protein